MGKNVVMFLGKKRKKKDLCVYICIKRSFNHMFMVSLDNPQNILATVAHNFIPCTLALMVIFTWIEVKNGWFEKHTDYKISIEDAERTLSGLNISEYISQMTDTLWIHSKKGGRRNFVGIFQRHIKSWILRHRLYS